jgi:hypothetical protein
MDKYFVQVGIVALRTPSGKHLPSTPLYIKAEHLTASGLTEWENESLTDYAGFYKEKILTKGAAK